MLLGRSERQVLAACVRTRVDAADIAISSTPWLRSKKYVIELLDGNKVTGRRRGITTTVCTGAVAASRETPDFALLQAGEKRRLAGDQHCIKAEGQVRSRAP